MPGARFIAAAAFFSVIGCAASETRKTVESGPEAAVTAGSAAPAGAQPNTSAAASPSGSAKSVTAPPTATPRSSGPLNVIMLVVDSLRADMPWAGYPRQVAPNLTALEKESIGYTHAYSVSSYTAKSVAAFLSGKYPSTLKRSGYFFTKYSPSNLFLAEVLQQAGVYTMSAHAHAYMNRGNGLDQGFQVWQVVPGITFDAQTDNHVTSDKLTPLVEKELDGAPPGKPFFLYVHYMDPHDKYMPHAEAPPFGKKARDRYDGEVFFADLHIGKLLEYCRSKPWWNQTAIIVTADHGEAFGEHGMYRHAFELWDMLTHVPLFVRLPGEKPRHIETPRSHVDLAPTILELMNVHADNDFAGKSLVPELRGGPAEPRPVLLDLPADSNNPERRALIDGNYKLMVLGSDYRFELYDLEKDPDESKSLAKEAPEKLAELKQRYTELWSKLKKVKPYGGNKLTGGGTASGPAD